MFNWNELQPFLSLEKNTDNTEGFLDNPFREFFLIELAEMLSQGKYLPPSSVFAEAIRFFKPNFEITPVRLNSKFDLSTECSNDNFSDIKFFDFNKFNQNFGSIRYLFYPKFFYEEADYIPELISHFFGDDLSKYLDLFIDSIEDYIASRVLLYLGIKSALSNSSTEKSTIVDKRHDKRYVKINRKAYDKACFLYATLKKRHKNLYVLSDLLDLLSKADYPLWKCSNSQKWYSEITKLEEILGCNQKNYVDELKECLFYEITKKDIISKLIIWRDSKEYNTFKELIIDNFDDYEYKNHINDLFVLITMLPPRLAQIFFNKICENTVLWKTLSNRDDVSDIFEAVVLINRYLYQLIFIAFPALNNCILSALTETDTKKLNNDDILLTLRLNITRQLDFVTPLRSEKPYNRYLHNIFNFTNTPYNFFEKVYTGELYYNPLNLDYENLKAFVQLPDREVKISEDVYNYFNEDIRQDEKLYLKRLKFIEYSLYVSNSSILSELDYLSRQLLVFWLENLDDISGADNPIGIVDEISKVVQKIYSCYSPEHKLLDYNAISELYRVLKKIKRDNYKPLCKIKESIRESFHDEFELNINSIDSSLYDKYGISIDQLVLLMSYDSYHDVLPFCRELNLKFIIDDEKNTMLGKLYFYLLGQLSKIKSCIVVLSCSLDSDSGNSNYLYKRSKLLLKGEDYTNLYKMILSRHLIFLSPDHFVAEQSYQNLFYF